MSGLVQTERGRGHGGRRVYAYPCVSVGGQGVRGVVLARGVLALAQRQALAEEQRKEIRGEVARHEVES